MPWCATASKAGTATSGFALNSSADVLRATLKNEQIDASLIDVSRPRTRSFSSRADYLYYTVRELFPSKNVFGDAVFGKVTSARPLKLISQTPEVGVIFSDGIECDFVAFNSGAQATVTEGELLR